MQHYHIQSNSLPNWQQDRFQWYIPTEGLRRPAASQGQDSQEAQKTPR